MDAIVNSISDACATHLPGDAGIENIDGMSVIVIDVLAGSQPPYFIKTEEDEYRKVTVDLPEDVQGREV